MSTFRLDQDVYVVYPVDHVRKNKGNEMMRNLHDELAHVVVVDLDQSAKNAPIKIRKNPRLYPLLPLDIDIQVSVEIAKDL